MAARDPLRLHVPLPHERRLAIVGVPVWFRAEYPNLLDAVDCAFGRWPATADPARVTVRLLAEVEGVEDAADLPWRARVPDPDHVVIASAGSLAFGDARRGAGVCYVSPEIRADPERLALRMLEGLTLTLVTRQDRTPVHASVIEREGVVLVLSAPSGTGKSTVAFAARSAGFRVVADDAAYVQREPVFGLWGTPGRHELPEDATTWFPEIADHAPRVMSNGRRKRLLPRGPGGVGPWNRVGVCLLSRTGGAIRRETVAPVVLVDALVEDLGPAADLYATNLQASLALLTRVGGWRLNIGGDPRDVVPHLEDMIATIP